MASTPAPIPGLTPAAAARCRLVCLATAAAEQLQDLAVAAGVPLDVSISIGPPAPPAPPPPPAPPAQPSGGGTVG